MVRKLCRKSFGCCCVCIFFFCARVENGFGVDNDDANADGNDDTKVM